MSRHRKREAVVRSERDRALHGLGHIQPYFTDRVVEVVTAYERRNVFVSPGLKQYAQFAKA